MKFISPRERIEAAFAHQEADRVPVFDVANNPLLYTHSLGEPNTYYDGPPAVRLAKKLGLDAAMVPAGNYTGLIKREHKWSGPGRFTDSLGVSFKVMESSWPLAVAEEISLDEELLESMTNADLQPWETADAGAAAAEAHQGKKDDIALFGGVRSSFGHLYMLGGMLNLTESIYDRTDFLKQLIKASTDYWTRTGLRLIELGVDALYVANDMGMNNSTIISPEHLRALFLPPFKEQLETWKEAGGKIILHSCGDIRSLLPDLAEMEIDGLNNLQEKAGMDIGEVKKQYGNKWTLIGNVDATDVMTSEHPEKIEEAVDSLLRRAASGGGLIAATDHSFHKGIPLENVFRFIEYVRKMGRYPLRKEYAS
ncbi:MAG: uroporphyrinogen decarboxylase family protein [Spirochaetia bacterium]